MIRECGRRARPCPCRRHVQSQGPLRACATSSIRPGSTARVHQHLNIGQGEVPWDDFYRTLHEIGFDGIMTACVFAWEDKADQVRHLHARPRCSNISTSIGVRNEGRDRCGIVLDQDDRGRRRTAPRSIGRTASDQRRGPSGADQLRMSARLFDLASFGVRSRPAKRSSRCAAMRAEASRGWFRAIASRSGPCAWLAQRVSCRLQ